MEDFGEVPSPRDNDDVGADDDEVVPAARIDAGAGGAAAGGNPSLLVGVITGATGAVGAAVARRRR